MRWATPLTPIIISKLLGGSGGGGGSGLTDNVKQALLDCFAHVAWVDANGADYYEALEEALTNPRDLVSISASFEQGGAIIYETDPLDSLKQNLTVTATYDDGTSATVSDYTLSGSLAAGTSTITVTYHGKTDTFSVTVTAWTIKWSYEDGDYPYNVDSENWKKITANNTVSFASGVGIRLNGTTGTFQTAPKDYENAENSTLEAVIRLGAISNKGGAWIRGGDSSVGVQAIVGRDGGVSMDNAATFISGVTLVTGKDYTVRVVFDNDGDCKTYLDGILISTVSASDIGSKSNQFMLTAGTGGTTTDVYYRALRFANA